MPTFTAMEYADINASDIPLELLFEADPSKERILSYLANSWCFAAKSDGKLVGACIAQETAKQVAEIVNVAVYPDYQQRGIGTALLQFTLQALAKKEIRRVELGTGSFGYQLTCYQRLGFRVESVVKDYFLTHYSEPIYENNLQHKDMLRLYLELNTD